MKKFLFVFVLCTGGIISNTYAACTVSGTSYSCFSGYYLNGTSCIRCPMVGTTTYGTSPNRNTGGIETCYAAANTTHTDQTGTFTFTSACQYTK